MRNVTTPQIDIPIPAREATFQIDGSVIEVLRGCGVATVHANTDEDLTVNRGTHGIHFNELNIGDRVNCEVAASDNRVVHAHQQTVPMRLSPPKP